jgi:DNA-binding NarL/FixJ family response regulator
MTGLEVMKKIQEEYQVCVGTFIMLTNQGQEEDIKAATDQGASGYIVKADSIPSEVVEQVEKIVSK